MVKRNFAKKILFPIWIVFTILMPWGMAQGGTSESVAWLNLETRYTIIHYQSLRGLKKFNNKLDFSPGNRGFGRLFTRPESNVMMHNLKKKIDALYERVQEILDMRKRMKKVIINIYHNKKQLDDAYYRICRRKCRIRAWYIYEYNTIYVNVDDLHTGMLAHEMAHSIIDNYLTVRPPSPTAEILARYVDSHIFSQ